MDHVGYASTMARTKIVLAGAGLLLIVLGLYLLLSREAPSAQLRALEADPLAHYVPPQGSLVDSSKQNEGSTFGKPVRARYRRMFVIPAADPERRLEHAVAAARAAGWEIVDAEPEPEPFGSLVAIGDKRLENGRAQMAITVFIDDTLLRGDVKSPAMRISLEHLGP